MPVNEWCRWSTSRPQTQTSSLIYQPLYRSIKQARSHSLALKTSVTACVHVVQLASHTGWPLRCAWWEQSLVSLSPSRRALAGTREIQGECWPSHSMGDCNGVALACCCMVDTAIPEFPTPRGGSACAGERQKFTSGEFMCCFPSPWRLMVAQRLSAFRDIFWHIS